MFNLKNIVSKITDRGRDSQPNSPGVIDDPLNNQGAEGFLCPKCMTAYPSPEELQSHYEEHHNSVEGSDVSGAGAGFSSLHQEAGFHLQRQGQSGQSVSQERLSAEIQGITNVAELQKSLMDAMESKAQLQFEKESLEQRTAQLARVNAAMKSVNDEEQGKSVALKERLNILEDQLAHRESIDDAAVLRQELVQVQRVMDEMTRERERERDELQTELQHLKTAYDLLQQNADQSEKVAELQTMIKKEKASKQEMEKHAKKVESLNEHEKTKKAELLSEVDTLKKNIKELMASSKTDAQTILQSQSQEQALKSEVSGLKRNLQEKSIEADNLSRELHSKKAEHESLLAKIDSLTKAQTHSASLIKDKDERLAKLAADLKRHASEGAGAAKAAVQQLAEENEARLSEIEAANEKLKAEKLASDNAVAKAKNDCSEKEAKIYELEKKLENCTEKIQGCETELYVVKSHSETLGTKLMAALETSVSLSEALDDLKNKSQLEREQITRKEEECNSLQLKVEMLLEECKVAEEEKKTMEITRASLETDMFELQKALTVLESESQDNLQDLKDEIMNMTTNLDAQSQTLLSRESDLKRCQEALATEVAARANDKVERDAAEERLRRSTDARIEELTKQVEEKQQHIDSLLLNQTEMDANINAHMESIKKEHELEVKKLQELLGMRDKTVEAQKAQLIALEQSKNAALEVVTKEKDELFSTQAEIKSKYKIKDEEVNAMQLLLDEVTGEKLVLEAHLQTSQTEQKTLMEKYYASSSDNETQRRNLDEFRRRCEDSQSALHELGRENQILRMELEKLLGRKWTEDSDVASCHLCHKEFSLLVRKHHCRNCGQIFCNECSAKSAPVANNKKPVRVCDGCYNELAAAM